MTVNGLSRSPDSISGDLQPDDNAMHGDDNISRHSVDEITSGEDKKRRLSLNGEAKDSIHSTEDMEKAGKDAAPTEPGTKQSEEYPEAPDGGYAWVVCFASFMLHMLMGGVARSEGLLFLQFQSRFGEGAQLTAWPGSLTSTINMFMGPVYGALCNRFSVRTVTIIASLLQTIGLILNGLAPNVYFLFLSHALIGGVGRGLMASFIMLNLYFDKHRSLATGLAASGVGLGSIWVVPLVQWLFNTYGFQGAFLILSGLPLNLLVCAMIYRPLSLHTKWNQPDKKKKEADVISEEGVALTSIIDSQHNNSDPSQVTAPMTIIYNEQLTSGKQNNYLDNITETLDVESSKSITTKSASDKLEKSSNGYHLSAKMDDGVCPGNCEQAPETAIQIAIPPTTMSTTNLRKRQGENCLKSSLKIIFPVEHGRKEGNKKVQAFHWHLVKHVPFMIFCLSNFFFVLSFKTCFIFLPAIALSRGLSDSEAALVLTISGAVDTFGRLAAGFILDLRPLRHLRPYVFNIALFIVASLTLLIPSLDSFTTYCIVSALFGAMTGAYISQKVVVLVDLLGREVVSSSVGIQKWFQGFGTLIGPPLAGALRDVLGSYDGSFYLSGASMVGAALLMFLSNVLIKLGYTPKPQTTSFVID